MNVFSNLSNQASGLGTSLGSWFKKGDAKPEEQEGEAPKEGASPQEQPSPASANASEQSVKGSADEHDDDAASQHSGATEGADSNPASEGEEEGGEGKAGFAAGLGFNLSGVSSRASAGAKTVGSFFSSAFSKAGASVKEASSRIKESVEKNNILAEFNKEQEAFLAAKGNKTGEAVPPWVGYPDEEKLKEEILALSTDRRNFVRSPPTGVTFEFELEAFLPVAQATLAADENLEKMRFELVPKVINEETFWRNYFYRVGLIRQSTELSSLEQEGTQEADAKPASQEGGKGLKGKEEDMDHPDSPNQGESEFVSDSFQPSSKDVEEVKRGISNLGVDAKPSGEEEDWEAELQEELGEFEVVNNTKEDDQQWEEEIQNMIDDEDSSDLR